MITKLLDKIMVPVQHYDLDVMIITDIFLLIIILVMFIIISFIIVKLKSLSNKKQRTIQDFANEHLKENE